MSCFGIEFNDIFVVTVKNFLYTTKRITRTLSGMYLRIYIGGF